MTNDTKPDSKEAHRTLVYLATPYSHLERSVRVSRFEAVNKVAAKLMAGGLHIFSPISHTHPIAEAGDLPRGWEFWQAYDRAILSTCSELIVLKLDGWQESKGVAGEIEIANELGIAIRYIEPDAAPEPQATRIGRGTKLCDICRKLPPCEHEPEPPATAEIPTPETDEKEGKVYEFYEGTDVVESSFARSLERRLAEMTREKEEWRLAAQEHRSGMDRIARHFGWIGTSHQIADRIEQITNIET